jgi:hypothetical protein
MQRRFSLRISELVRALPDALMERPERFFAV